PLQDREGHLLAGVHPDRLRLERIGRGAGRWRIGLLDHVRPWGEALGWRPAPGRALGIEAPGNRGAGRSVLTVTEVHAARGHRSPVRVTELALVEDHRLPFDLAVLDPPFDNPRRFRGHFHIYRDEVRPDQLHDDQLSWSPGCVVLPFPDAAGD